MACTNVGRGGGGGRGFSDHEAARGWGQISIRTNTSGTCSKTNATISADTRVQKSVQTNTSRTRYETNANTSEVQKSIQTNTSRTHYETNANTSGSRSEKNTGVQKSIWNNTSGTRSKTNATMSSDTWVQEPVGEDELNTDVSQHRRGSNIIEQVPQDPSKRTMISLDGREFTDPKVVHKITSILKTMFNGSWTTWKEELFKWEGLSDVLVHDAWENSMKKRYSDIMSKAINKSVKLAKAAGVQFEGADCTILKPYNLEWIKSKHWEDMIDRVWKIKKWLNKEISGSKNQNTVKEGSVSKHCVGSITISQHKRKFTAYNGSLVEKYGSDPANHRIYDDDLWKKCVGDDMKGGVLGWGSIVRGELKEELKKEVKVNLMKEMKVDLKEEMKADLKEEMKNELKE
nr:hypothetical protein [Tanacetum cinerariifolium]